jgi:hypothetical protein
MLGFIAGALVSTWPNQVLVGRIRNLKMKKIRGLYVQVEWWSEKDGGWVFDDFWWRAEYLRVVDDPIKALALLEAQMAVDE